MCIVYSVLVSLEFPEGGILSQATNGEQELLPLLVLGTDLVTDGNVSHHIDRLQTRRVVAS